MGFDIKIIKMNLRVSWRIKRIMLQISPKDANLSNDPGVMFPNFIPSWPWHLLLQQMKPHLEPKFCWVVCHRASPGRSFVSSLQLFPAVENSSKTCGAILPRYGTIGKQKRLQSYNQMPGEVVQRLPLQHPKSCCRPLQMWCQKQLTDENCVPSLEALPLKPKKLPQVAPFVPGTVLVSWWRPSDLLPTASGPKCRETWLEAALLVPLDSLLRQFPGSGWLLCDDTWAVSIDMPRLRNRAPTNIHHPPKEKKYPMNPYDNTHPTSSIPTSRIKDIDTMKAFPFLSTLPAADLAPLVLPACHGKSLGSWMQLPPATVCSESERLAKLRRTCPTVLPQKGTGNAETKAQDGHHHHVLQYIPYISCFKNGNWRSLKDSKVCTSCQLDEALKEHLNPDKTSSPTSSEIIFQVALFKVPLAWDSISLSAASLEWRPCTLTRPIAATASSLVFCRASLPLNIAWIFTAADRWSAAAIVSACLSKCSPEQGCRRTRSRFSKLHKYITSNTSIYSIWSTVYANSSGSLLQLKTRVNKVQSNRIQSISFSLSLSLSLSLWMESLLNFWLFSLCAATDLAPLVLPACHGKSLGSWMQLPPATVCWESERLAKLRRTCPTVLPQKGTGNAETKAQDGHHHHVLQYIPYISCFKNGNWRSLKDSKVCTSCQLDEALKEHLNPDKTSSPTSSEIIFQVALFKVPLAWDSISLSAASLEWRPCTLTRPIAATASSLVFCRASLPLNIAWIFTAADRWSAAAIVSACLSKCSPEQGCRRTRSRFSKLHKYITSNTSIYSIWSTVYANSSGSLLQLKTRVNKVQSNHIQSISFSLSLSLSMWMESLLNFWLFSLCAATDLAPLVLPACHGKSLGSWMQLPPATVCWESERLAKLRRTCPTVLPQKGTGNAETKAQDGHHHHVLQYIPYISCFKNGNWRSLNKGYQRKTKKNNFTNLIWNHLPSCALWSSHGLRVHVRLSRFFGMKAMYFDSANRCHGIQFGLRLPGEFAPEHSLDLHSSCRFRHGIGTGGYGKVSGLMSYRFCLGRTGTTRLFRPAGAFLLILRDLTHPILLGSGQPKSEARLDLPYLRLRQCGCCICCTSSTAGTEELLRQSGWFWLCRIWSSCWRRSSEVKASKLWSCWLRCPTSFSFKKASVRCLADWALVSLTWWRLLLWCFRQTKSKTGLAVCRLQGRAVCPFLFSFFNIFLSFLKNIEHHETTVHCKISRPYLGKFEEWFCFLAWDVHKKASWWILKRDLL